ncbi:MAG: VOC family protein [Candidatus Odinarchaeota archaeon]
MSKQVRNIKPTLKFESTVFFVNDIESSKYFYNIILGQKIMMDFGRNVGFEGGFAIWEKNYALNTIFSKEAKNIKVGMNNFEIYFECAEIEKIFKKLKKQEIQIIHPIIEHPWGQRAFRIYDPDDHIIEIAEPMSEVVVRLHVEGKTIEEIAQKSLMPIEFIKSILSNIQE